MSSLGLYRSVDSHWRLTYDPRVMRESIPARYPEDAEDIDFESLLKLLRPPRLEDKNILPDNKLDSSRISSSFLALIQHFFRQRFSGPDSLPVYHLFPSEDRSRLRRKILDFVGDPCDNDWSYHPPASSEELYRAFHKVLDCKLFSSNGKARHDYFANVVYESVQLVGSRGCGLERPGNRSDFDVLVCFRPETTRGNFAGVDWSDPVSLACFVQNLEEALQTTLANRIISELPDFVEGWSAPIQDVVGESGLQGQPQLSVRSLHLANRGHVAGILCISNLIVDDRESSGSWDLEFEIECGLDLNPWILTLGMPFLCALKSMGRGPIMLYSLNAQRTALIRSLPPVVVDCVRFLKQAIEMLRCRQGFAEDIPAAGLRSAASASTTASVSDLTSPMSETESEELPCGEKSLVSGYHLTLLTYSQYLQMVEEERQRLGLSFDEMKLRGVRPRLLCQRVWYLIRDAYSYASYEALVVDTQISAVERAQDSHGQPEPRFILFPPFLGMEYAGWNNRVIQVKDPFLGGHCVGSLAINLREPTILYPDFRKIVERVEYFLRGPRTRS